MKTKEEREAKALQKLEEEFWETDIRENIHSYHKRDTDEAKFVYALDKLIPEYNIYLTDGSLYKDFNISREELVKHLHKTYVYKPLQPFADAIIQEAYEHDEWFNF